MKLGDTIVSSLGTNNTGSNYIAFFVFFGSDNVAAINEEAAIAHAIGNVGLAFAGACESDFKVVVDASDSFVFESHESIDAVNILDVLDSEVGRRFSALNTT